MHTIPKHKVFISYHHANDQWYKQELLRLNNIHDLFIDGSVDTGDIDDNLSNETIRQKIRDEYLGNSTVTILLVGTETKNRKHIDWELKSSMIDGKFNKKSGILIIHLPTINHTVHRVSHIGEKEIIYPEIKDWSTLNHRSKYEQIYPFLPARIIDNLINVQAKISVTSWDKMICNFIGFKFLIHKTFDDKDICEYDLSRPMRINNS